MHFSKVLSGLSLAAAAVAAPAAHGGYSQCGQITPKQAALVVSQFTTDGVIPDLIEAPTLNTPDVKVSVVYGTKAVNLGTYFTTAQTLVAPKLTFTGEKKFNPATTKYIYFLVDPDVPQDGSMAQVNFLHWAVRDAQPFCIRNQAPVTVVPYQPLTPASTTQHRYTFLVYRQPANFDINLLEGLLLTMRTPFDLNDFTQDNGLKLVGGNFLKEAIVNTSGNL